MNSLGALDLLQVAVSGLKPNPSYTLWLVKSRAAPFGNKEALVTFKTNLTGAKSRKRLARCVRSLRIRLARPSNLTSASYC